MRPGIRLAVFDFDGTLSWLRHGWPGMMTSAFFDLLPPGCRDLPALGHDLLLDDILALNGHPAIKQCERLAQIAKSAGIKNVPDGETIRTEFQRRLDAAIVERIESLRSGKAEPKDFIIVGAIPLLTHLQASGIEVAILSSTVQPRVIEEAGLLGLAPYFGTQIFGGTGDPRQFSKRAIFERMLEERGLTGEALLSFGDGPVEIAATKELGGLAIAVCTDEDVNGSGKMDARKWEQLMGTGAIAAVADFREAITLVNKILGK